MHKAFSLDDITRLITDSIPYWRAKICCSSRVLLQIDLRADLGLLVEKTDRPGDVAHFHLASLYLESHQRLCALSFPSCHGSLEWFTPTQDFVVEPSEEQWDHFSIYARRMRAITEPRAFLPSQDAVQILSNRFSTKPMLPLLRSLTWLFVSSARLQSCVPLLVSPHLAHIRLHFRDNSPEHCLPVIQTLIGAAGSLESVEITPEFDRPEMQDAVSTLLLSCNSNLLHRFCVASPISGAALLHAVQLPELQEFSLRGGTPGLTDPLPLMMFPSLRTILISMGGLPTWLEILRHIQSKFVTELSVDFEVGDDKNLLTISTHLQHSEIHRTLTELRLCPGEGWIIDKASISPLLVLGELTFLGIFTECQEERCIFSLSDQDIERLAKAMPKLEVLSLGVPCSAQMRDDLTVKSLLAIAKYCKALKALEAHINCESIVMSTYEREVPGSFPSHTKIPSTTTSSDYDGCPLSLATFGSCPIPMDGEGGVVVAMTLLRLFPRLSRVRWSGLGKLPPWWFVSAIVADHNLVQRSLAKFGESVYVHPCEIGLTTPQLIGLPSLCKLPFSPWIPCPLYMYEFHLQLSTPIVLASLRSICH